METSLTNYESYVKKQTNKRKFLNEELDEIFDSSLLEKFKKMQKI